MAAESRGAAMWTDEQRARHVPSISRYPSDITDAEWTIIEPMIPAAGTGRRRRETGMREVFNAIRYIGRTGCHWRLLPKDFLPFTMVYRYFWEWLRYCILDQIHKTLLEQCRIACRREPDPTAGVIDTQVA